MLNTVVFDYMIEAQFIGFFNNYFIRREIHHTCKDAIDDIAIGEVIEDYCERMLYEAIPIIAQNELNAEIKRYDCSTYSTLLVVIKKRSITCLANI